MFINLVLAGPTVDGREMADGRHGCAPQRGAAVEEDPDSTRLNAARIRVADVPCICQISVTEEAGMTAIGHGTRFAFSDRGVRLSRMRVPWTRGATSGALLVILGAWAAIVPFIGPYLNFAYTPATNTTWQ